MGLLYASVAVFGQAASNVLVKYGAEAGGEGVGALEASVVRLAIGALGVGIYLGALGRITETMVPFRSLASTKTVLLATFLGTYLGIWLSAYGVIHAEVGVAATLNATSPLFVLPLAVWMEGERLSLRSITGAVIAVAGVGLFFWA